MKLPPAVMVHGLDHARAALAPGLPVTLLSARGAGLYAGAGWWLALVEAARGDAPVPPHILDCGGAAGRALEAARAGQARIVLRAAAAILQEASGIAASYGAELLGEAPACVDLGAPGANRHLADWLAADSGHGSGRKER